MSTTNVSGNNTAAANNSVLFGSDNKAKAATNKKPTTPVTVVLPAKEKEKSKPVEATATVQQPTPAAPEMLPIQKHIPTIQEMQGKAKKMNLLSEKYDNLSYKKQDLDVFSISHDGDTAHLILTDAKGHRFESSNPVCIRKLIEIWKQTYSEALDRTENEMRQLMEA